MPHIIGRKKRYNEPTIYNAYGEKIKPDAKVLYDAKGRPIIKNVVHSGSVDLRKELLQHIPKSARLTPRELEMKKELMIKISSLGSDLPEARKLLSALPEYLKITRTPEGRKYAEGMDIDELLEFCETLFEMRETARAKPWFEGIEKLSRHRKV